MGCGGLGLPRGRLLWGSLGPSRTLHLGGAKSALSRQLAYLCHPGTTLQRGCGQVLILNIQVFMSRLVGEAEKVRAVGWRVLEDFLFSLGICQIDSMFGEALDLLIFLLVFQHLHLNLTALSTAAFHYQTSLHHRCFLVDPQMFSLIFSRLDFPHISSVPLLLALLEAVSMMNTFWYSEPLAPWGTRSLGEGRITS